MRDVKTTKQYLADQAKAKQKHQFHMLRQQEHDVSYPQNKEVVSKQK